MYPECIKGNCTMGMQRMACMSLCMPFRPFITMLSGLKQGVFYSRANTILYKRFRSENAMLLVDIVPF